MTSEPDVENPLVSIITPSYNQGKYLEAAICSVLEQDYPRIEYIVIDGGSQDGSQGILERYSPRLAYCVSEIDSGQAHAVDKGLERASGSILGWLNSDDRLLPDTVSRAVSAFREHPAVDVVYGRLERIDEEGKSVPTPILPKDRSEFSKEHILGECIVNQPGSFWRRKIMEKAGRLDIGLRYVMDYEYWIRLALNGARFMRLPEVVAQFRLNPDSKTVSQSASMAEEQLKVLERLREKVDLARELGISREMVDRRLRTTRAHACLLAFYGEWKRKDYPKARDWLLKALTSDPTVILERRWLDLWLARLRRR